MQSAERWGYPLPDNLKQQMWDFYHGVPHDTTASMMRDILAGRPSELDAWNGAIVRFGKQVGRTDTRTTSLPMMCCCQWSAEPAGRFKVIGKSERTGYTDDSHSVRPNFLNECLEVCCSQRFDAYCPGGFVKH
ncbi:MAG: hypothetical protein CM1200mP18_15520 [Gammaproteobacteria bacterium]|nr:MAG: hypothetical protein CM1200mP18_15520 [Gammaproteobacteria bacterium]